ncbi:hypothetical protein BwSF19_77230 [Bradyrhizobium ottawaense]|nr:hypothetical protein BwSF19_77230 [Bradyrhizobium ottawaense]
MGPGPSPRPGPFNGAHPGEAAHYMVCADNGEAKERAKSLVDIYPIQLWQSDHKLATFDPDPMTDDRAQGWLKGELRPPK